MKTRVCCLVVLLLFAFFFPDAKPVSAALNEPSYHTVQDECIETLTGALEDESFLVQLADPIITTTEQLSERKDLYRKIYHCLRGDLSALADDLKMIDILTEYFLVFVDGIETPAGQSELVLVDLAHSENPAIKRIRDEAKVEPPDGFIYVRTYTSLDAMPELVRRGFDNEDTVGVTMLTRYVAILAEEKGDAFESELQSQDLPKTISHELVHAYVNSVLGFESSQKIPVWYHEGVAIYFSGSTSSSYVYLTPDISLRSAAPEEYLQYELNFRYLEAELGKDVLLERINSSIENRDPGLLYQGLGITSYKRLESSAKGWEEARFAKIRNWGLIVVALIIAIFWWIFSHGEAESQN